MSFLLPCPHCGPRSVYEYRFGGEVKELPPLDAPESSWIDYRFYRTNTPGVQTEWWLHRSGCGQWIQAVRNTTSNEVLESYLPEEKIR